MDCTDVNEKRSSGDSLNTLIGAPQRHKMSFLIKGRDGFTKKLLKKARRTTDGSLKVTALAEGPFGRITSFLSWDGYADALRWTSFSLLLWNSSSYCRGNRNHTSDIVSTRVRQCSLYTQTHSSPTSELDLGCPKHRYALI